MRQTPTDVVIKSERNRIIKIIIDFYNEKHIYGAYSKFCEELLERIK